MVFIVIMPYSIPARRGAFARGRFSFAKILFCLEYYSIIDANFLHYFLLFVLLFLFFFGI